jgi:hypothetical protein
VGEAVGEAEGEAEVKVAGEVAGEVKVKAEVEVKAGGCVYEQAQLRQQRLASPVSVVPSGPLRRPRRKSVQVPRSRVPGWAK